MSSDQRSVDLNVGRTNVHADLGINRGVGHTGVVTTGAQLVGQTLASEAQTTCLISNEPRTVVMQEQRIASNIPITTEKHITREFIPVVHEEMVTMVPIVTGQAVHTGTAIAGEKFVQQVGVEVVKQSAATRIDITPEVQTSLGAQQVISMPVNQQAHYVGQATVVSQQNLQGLNQGAQFISQSQPGLAQGFTETQTFVSQSQPLINQTQQILGQNMQAPLSSSLSNQIMGSQQLPSQVLGTNQVQSQGLQQQQFLNQQGLNQGFSQQPLLGSNLNQTSNIASQALNAAANLERQAARDVRKL
jgi:hypothetical protein